MNIPYGLSVILLVASFAYSDGVLAWVDITKRIRDETDLDDKIREACKRDCQGNRRKGDLTSVQVRKVRPGQYEVIAKAYAKNHHHIDPPKVFGRPVGGGAAAYSWTIDVTARGMLDTASCDLTYRQIDVSGDQTGLVRDAVRKKQGQPDHIDNCENLVRGI